MGNLGHGRKLWTDTTCGYNSTELYCSYSENTDLLCKRPKFSKCNSMNTHLAHPPSAMVDSSFRLPHTWWQSAQGVEREKIQLNLETEFYFTHLIMIFKSPRPAAMVLERSQDFGKTWKPYKYFSINCSAAFELDDDVTKKDALCTSRYSSHFPCTGGEVIYRALSPPNSADDPYSPKIQAQLKITNLRVQLLKRQSCPCHSNDLNANPPQLTYYAIYDFIVKGSCFCNGHADRCAPLKGFRPVKGAGVFHVVHGRCICKHNTAGTHCQHCAPLYNDQPWLAANGQTGAPNGCKSCKCNGHSDTCHFDMDTWLASGNQSGGICDNCQHNTEGQHCERCKPGFYRDLRKPFSAPDTCKLCSCNPIGSAMLPFSNSTFCDPSISFKILQGKRNLGRFGLPDWEIYQKAVKIIWIKEWITLQNRRILTLEGHDLLEGWHTHLWDTKNKKKSYFHKHKIRETLIRTWEEIRQRIYTKVPNWLSITEALAAPNRRDDYKLATYKDILDEKGKLKSLDLLRDQGFNLDWWNYLQINSRFQKDRD
ncbi:netrin-4 isoform X2 [Pantherophis guttatus]|nr:netrin-4 isoform X2 [Pantherophis guttatus]